MTYPPPGQTGYGSQPAGHGPPEERLDFAAEYDIHSLPLPDPETLDSRWDLEGDLARLLRSSTEEHTQAAEPIRRHHAATVKGRGRRRRVRFRLPVMPWLQLASLIFAAITAAIVAMLSVLSGMISYGPLRFLAVPSTTESLADWWPLLVYGPWLVASLSVLRAALHHRGAGHSWAVVVLFSAIAVLLCVAHAPKTLPGVSVAALPPLAALVSFHQLVRQITLNNPPRHALPRQRGPERS